MKWKLRQKENLFLRNKEYIFAAVILLCFWKFNIGGVYGFSILPDEFVYWSYAAEVNGYDWSDIASLAPYFSYGYSLILIPLFTLCKNAVTAYRIAVSMNFVFLFWGLTALIKTMLKTAECDKCKVPVAMFCLLAILLPCNLFYTQMTLTETLLVSLYIAAGSLLFQYLENNRLSTLILLMLTLMYLYMVHMRTVGVLISAVTVLCLHILYRKDKIWHVLVIAFITAILLLAAGMIKQYAFASVYGGLNQEFVASNDYNGQFDKIQYIFTWEGFYDLIVGILGKILYLGLATWGVFYWGMYALIRHTLKMLHNMKRHMEITPQQIFALFLLLSAAAQIIIASVYLLTLGEISDYTYGRYLEMISPFIMVWGFITMWKEKTQVILCVTGVLALVQMLITYMVVRQIIITEADNFQGYFMVGMSYLYDENNFCIDKFYIKAYLLCEILTLVITALVLFCRSAKKRQYIMVMCAVMELALAVHADRIYTGPFKRAAFRDSRVADIINDLTDSKRRIIYMDEVFPSYIGIIQFMARDMDIHVMERRKTVSDYDEDILPEDILIFAFDDAFLKEWTERYDHEDTYGHFTLLYND